MTMPSWLRRCIACLDRPRVLAGLFLLCALPTGLGIAWLAPPGMAPDEVPHIVRADALRLGQFTATKVAGSFPKFQMNVSVFMVLNAREVYVALTGKPVPPEDEAYEKALYWFPNTLECPSQMAEYFPVFYVPAVIGLQGGKSMGMSPIYAVYTGRLVMLAAYLAMGAAALLLARCGGTLIFAVLTLPPSLAIGASYNQDGGMLACAALAAALLTRSGFAAKAVSWAALLAVALAKLPYLPLLGLGLLPLRGPGLLRRMLLLGLAASAPLLWLAHISHGGFVPYKLPAYHPGPLWPGPRDGWLTASGFGENLRVLRARPDIVLWMPVASVVSSWSSLWPHLFCMTAYERLRLGSGDWPFQAAALVAAFLGTLLERGPGRPRWDGGFAALVLFGAFTTMEISLYLTFTTVGALRIDGVQARYFLPLLPFFILVLPGCLPWRLRGAGRLARVPQGLWVLPALAVAMVHIYTLPAAIFHMFRMAGP